MVLMVKMVLLFLALKELLVIQDQRGRWAKWGLVSMEKGGQRDLLVFLELLVQQDQQALPVLRGHKDLLLLVLLLMGKMEDPVQQGLPVIQETQVVQALRDQWGLQYI